MFIGIREQVDMDRLLGSGHPQRPTQLPLQFGQFVEQSTLRF
jgi:hypothetical protein